MHTPFWNWKNSKAKKDEPTIKHCVTVRSGVDVRAGIKISVKINTDGVHYFKKWYYNILRSQFPSYLILKQSKMIFKNISFFCYYKLKIELTVLFSISF